MRHIAVIDIGKTNAKLALVDLAARSEIAVLTRANAVIDAPPYPHFDTDGIWEFVLDGLAQMHATHGIDGISVTTHGACAALLAADGTLATPVLDYEHSGPDAVRAEYDALRPPFAQTGSPALPHGLNLGAQLHWLLARDATLSKRVAHIVTWPQYWGFRLTGAVACDLSSLGSHTDLWNPHLGTFSALPERLGIAAKMAPPCKPGEVLGPLLPALQRRIGLEPVPVLCGIHDSNASLLPHLLTCAPPFAVVSTGTWVIAMAVGADPVPLDPAQDTLVNVSALANPVPSARFMGGREYEMVRGGVATSATPADASRVLSRGVMLFPSVVPHSGPFQWRISGWSHPDRTAAETEVALGYYLALMTAECLSAIGAQGPTLIEGPFAANPWFTAMLAAATGRAAIASPQRTGTAVGAALLFAPPVQTTQIVVPDAPVDPALAIYAARWRAAVG